MSTDFNEFFDRREQAAQAYATGDGAPIAALVPHEGDATFHSPGGDTVMDAKLVADRYLNDAKAFKLIGASRFEVLQRGSDGDLGFWTGFQVARVRIGDMPEPVEMKLRATEIFRRIDGDWKMIHRHADAGAGRG
jgi:ketosteroid isomerase-like protein